MTSWASQSQLTSYQSLYSTSAGGWGEVGGVVGVAVLLTVGVGVGLGGQSEDLVSLAGALALTASLTGALSLDSALASDFAASLTGALSLDSALASDFAASLTGALSLDSALTVGCSDSSAPAGMAPSRNTRSATILATTPLFITTLLKEISRVVNSARSSAITINNSRAFNRPGLVGIVIMITYLAKTCKS